MKYLFTLLLAIHCHAASLQTQYHLHWRSPSDINEHLPHLRRLAKECPSVTELGVRSMNSTWGLLLGLSENPSFPRTYLGVDLSLPPPDKFTLARDLAEKNGISFTFWEANDLKIDLPQTDLLFIDTYHTYCHLTYELEAFSPRVRKYIAMHDTSEPWGGEDEGYSGDYSEYPATIDKNKRGLWQAVVDFLSTHPEWKLAERHHNNHGFTILKRRE
ncbi:MAG TPA: hypothetical protein VLE89_07115 [Chlamydiales bacterium]|nr:hypothetical protein [Chlamydiales bacterium]